MTGLEIIGATMAVASAATGAMGAMQQANAQASAATYSAQVAARNRQIAINQAGAERDDASNQNKRSLAQIHALYGSSGFDTGTGSALDAMADSAGEGLLNEKRATYKGEIRALGLTDQENVATATAKNASAAGPIAATGSIVRAGTSLLSLGKGNSFGFGD
jgi:hypothetical protein